MAGSNSTAPEGNVLIIKQSTGMIMPSMVEFLEACWQDEPLLVPYLQCSGIFCVVVAWVISCRHIHALYQARTNLRRGLYIQLSAIPAVLGIIAALALLCPSSARILRLIQKTYEAHILYKFGVLLFILLAGESAAKTAIDPESAPSQRGMPDGLDYAVKIQEALAANGPRKHFGVPPLGCCWRPCLPEHDLSLRHLSWVSLMIQQFVMVMPAIATAQVYLVTMMRVEDALKIIEVLDVVSKAANLICLYGLVIVFFSTKELLKRWHTHKKFVAIKVVLVIAIWQDFLVKLIAHGPIKNSDSCFKAVYIERALVDRPDSWVDMEEYFWATWILALETIPMALLICKSFPVAEINERVFEVSHEMVELGIWEGDATGKASPSTSEQEEDSSEDVNNTGDGPSTSAPSFADPSAKSDRAARCHRSGRGCLQRLLACSE